MWGITELKVLCVDSQGRKLIKGQLTDSSMSLKWKRDTVICCSIFHVLVNISLLNICPFKKKKKNSEPLRCIILFCCVISHLSHFISQVGKGKN